MKNKTATECWNILRGEIDSAIDSFVPMKRQGKRSKKKHLSKEAFRKIRHKQNMWRVYKHTGKDQNDVVYKEALNAATNEVRKSKRNFELKLVQNIKSDSKSFYAYASKQNVRDKVGPLEDNAGDIIIGGYLVAEELNMHFSSVFTREDTSSLPVPETKFKEAFRKIRHKQNMWRVYKHTGKEQNDVVYKEALNAATNEVRKSKRNFELKLVKNIKSDSKSFYAYVRSKQNVRDKVGPREDNAWDIIIGFF